MISAGVNKVSLICEVSIPRIARQVKAYGPETGARRRRPVDGVRVRDNSCVDVLGILNRAGIGTVHVHGRCRQRSASTYNFRSCVAGRKRSRLLIGCVRNR
jgi:hypothetical protein